MIWGLFSIVVGLLVAVSGVLAFIEVWNRGAPAKAFGAGVLALGFAALIMADGLGAFSF